MPEDLEKRIERLEFLLRTHQHAGFDTTSILKFQDWKQIGKIQLIAAATSMSIAIPQKSFLRIFIQWGAKSGVSNDFLRFNSDSGNNYTTTTGVSHAQIDLRNGANSALCAFAIIDVANNIASQVKR